MINLYSLKLYESLYFKPEGDTLVENIRKHLNFLTPNTGSILRLRFCSILLSENLTQKKFEDALADHMHDMQSIGDLAGGFKKASSLSIYRLLVRGELDKILNFRFEDSPYKTNYLNKINSELTKLHSGEGYNRATILKLELVNQILARGMRMEKFEELIGEFKYAMNNIDVNDGGFKSKGWFK